MRAGARTARGDAEAASTNRAAPLSGHRRCCIPSVTPQGARPMNVRHQPIDSLERETRAAEREIRLAARRQHVDHVAEVALAGTVAGAAVGALAGPAGALAGAVMGG